MNINLLLFVSLISLGLGIAACIRCSLGMRQMGRIRESAQ